MAIFPRSVQQTCPGLENLQGLIHRSPREPVDKTQYIVIQRVLDHNKMLNPHPPFLNLVVLPV